MSKEIDVSKAQQEQGGGDSRPSRCESELQGSCRRQGKGVWDFWDCVNFVGRSGEPWSVSISISIPHPNLYSAANAH